LTGGMALESSRAMARANEDNAWEQQRLQRIRERAYALYLERGETNDGSAVDDWLRAERELADTVRAPRAVLNRDVGDGMSAAGSRGAGYDRAELLGGARAGQRAGAQARLGGRRGHA
jgi:hypothetical protein